MANTEELVAKGIATGRILYGVGCMVAPRKMVGPAGPRAEGMLTWMVRTFGVRDVLLGAGTLAALAEGSDSARLWLQVSAAADSLDLANALVFRKELDRTGRMGVVALAVPAAVGGWWAAQRLRPAR